MAVLQRWCCRVDWFMLLGCAVWVFFIVDFGVVKFGSISSCKIFVLL